MRLNHHWRVNRCLVTLMLVSHDENVDLANSNYCSFFFPLHSLSNVPTHQHVGTDDNRMLVGDGSGIYICFPLVLSKWAIYHSTCTSLTPYKVHAYMLVCCLPPYKKILKKKHSFDHSDHFLLYWHTA